MRAEIEIPLYGTAMHVDSMRDRLRSVIGLKFPGAKIADLDQWTVGDDG